MWRSPSLECGAPLAAPRIGRSGVAANTPQRGLGELALAMLASYVLTRQHGLVWWCSAAIVGAIACGRSGATLLTLLVAVSGRGEASGRDPLAVGVSARGG